VISNLIHSNVSTHHNHCGLGANVACSSETSLLTVGETAMLLRTDEDTVIALVNNGKLVGYIPCGELLIKASSLQNFIDKSLLTTSDLKKHKLVGYVQAMKKSETSKLIGENNESIENKAVVSNAPKLITQVRPNKENEGVFQLPVGVKPNKSKITKKIEQAIAKTPEVPQSVTRLAAEYNKANSLSVEYINHFENGTKAFTKYPGLRIRKNKKSKKIFLRIPKKDIIILELDANHAITEREVSNIEFMYKRYQELKEAGCPCNDVKYLRGNTARKLVTFNDFFDFAIEKATSRSVYLKIIRMKKKYFSGEKGRKKLNLYCQETFVEDWLNDPEMDKTKSHRDLIINIMSSTYNKAVASASVERPDFDNLVEGLPRNKSKKTKKVFPELETYVTILKKAFDDGYFELSMNLILQETLLTRKAVTTHQTWRDIDLDKNLKEVPAHKNKNRQYGRYIIPDKVKIVLRALKNMQKADPSTTKMNSRIHKGEPLFLFESPEANKKGQARANFDDHLKRVKTACCKDIDAQVISYAEKENAKKVIMLFTPHRLRDLSDTAFTKSGSSHAQKEHAAGRSTTYTEQAYEDLSDATILICKNDKFNYIADKYPAYKEVVDKLVKHFNAR